MKSLLFFLVIVLWIFLQSFTPAEVYWRDTGEFIIAAAFLDVSHPAGFPLYGQLGNLFSLIPFGSIAWRVNLFSTLVVLFNLILSYFICRLLLREELRLSESVSALISFIPPCIMLFSPTYLKQAYSAEVYVLNCVFIQVLILLYLFFRSKNDLRYLILSAFVAGLACGNHVSFGLILIPFILLVFCGFKKISKVIVPCFFAGILGMMVYGYIPVRARTYPPLNTGQAINSKRLLNLVTNERDRQLRNYQQEDNEKIDISVPKPKFWKSLAATFWKDTLKLKNEMSWIILVVALGGVFVMAGSSLMITGIFLSIVITNWYFFKGWNPDPWIPLFFALGIFSAFLVGFASTKCKTIVSAKRSGLIAAVFSAVVILSGFWNPLTALSAMKNYDVPSQSARNLLKPIPLESVYIAENTWFLMEYLSLIEHYRDDLTTVYTMDIQRPDLFKSVELEDSSGKGSYSSAHSFNESSVLKNENYAGLRSFLDFTAKRALIGFEPGNNLNNYLKGLAIFDPTGFAFLKWRESGRYHPTYLESTIGRLEKIKESAGILPAASFGVTRYFEMKVNNIGSLLVAAGQKQAAISLYRRLCLPVSNSLCSVVSFNNLAANMIDERDYLAGAKLLLKVISVQTVPVRELKHNLSFALGHLNSKEVEELKNGYPEVLRHYRRPD